MATLVYLSLSGMAPPYLAADCQLVSDEGRRQLRSANSRTRLCPLLCFVKRNYTAAVEKDVLLLQVLGCETTFQLI